MSFKNNIAYAILPPTDITQEMINYIRTGIEFSSIEDLRKNIDNSKIVIKFKVESGAPFGHLIWYNRQELKVELAKDEWQIKVDRDE